MLKKTLATGVLVLATATGALVTSTPASAAAPSWGGGWGSFSSGRLFSSNRNFNANRNVLFNRIRLRIRNVNNNVAINNQRQAQGRFLRGLGFDDD